jgi:hypothetical protein
MNSRNSNGTFVRTHNEWKIENWDDGYYDNKGRFRVYCPSYPRAYKDGYALRAHVVYWIMTGSPHPQNTELHHVDKTKNNDKFENLIPLSRSKHQLAHKENWISIICSGCQKPFMAHAWRVRSRPTKFCSRECYQNTPRTEEHKNSISMGVSLSHKNRGHNSRR